jgi:hypothetical protein
MSTSKLITSAREEMRVLYSTANAFHRQVKLGVADLARETATEHRVKIRILTPLDDSIKQLGFVTANDGDDNRRYICHIARSSGRISEGLSRFESMLITFMRCWR